MRTLACLVVTVLLATACAGSTAGDVDVAGIDEDGVLSPCEPTDRGTTRMVVQRSDERPPLDEMEAALADSPDAQFVVDQLVDEGVAREDAVLEMYAQEVGRELFEDARLLPGYVTGAVASPLDDEPFRLAFSGAVPDTLRPDQYDLAPFGLEVTTGAGAMDPDTFAEAYGAAQQVGIRVVSGAPDQIAGTGRIEVVDATPAQVADWEALVDQPERFCMVRAPRTQPCDDEVVAESQRRAERQGEVIPHGGEDTAPTAARADAIRRSYLGLTLAEARAKATDEGREARVVVEDGVELGRTDDLVPGRANLSVCQGTVVGVEVEGVDADG